MNNSLFSNNPLAEFYALQLAADTRVWIELQIEANAVKNGVDPKAAITHFRRRAGAMRNSLGIKSRKKLQTIIDSFYPDARDPFAGFSSGPN